MLRCGLLGEKLGHSYSPAIHSLLGGYEYRLCECPPERLGAFLRGGDWDGLNVTMPYKKSVVPYCAELSAAARRLGNVNTIVRREDGTLYGSNTDAYGFERMTAASGISVSGRKVLVLGSGGASNTACAVLRDLGAAEVVVISRSGEDNYQNLSRHRDAQVIVNTTPVGMFPGNGAAAVDLTDFPACRGVLDVVYNPARTALILQAEALGIPCKGGLHMLVAQAKRSSELFTGRSIDDGEIARIEGLIGSRLQNVILIGMPGCGKSTVAAALGERLGRPVRDADECVARKAGMPVPEIFSRFGEDRFRALETQALEELGKLSGAVIATGGGCVTRAENYPLLHQNGRIFWLKRALEALPADGRPLSLSSTAEELYARRAPLYARFADVAVDNNGPLEQTVERIAAALA